MAMAGLLQFLELDVGQILDRGDAVRRTFHRDHQLREFDLESERAVLGVLNQKHHEKDNDGRRRVDDELPGVAVLKERPRYCLDDNECDADQERDRLAVHFEVACAKPPNHDSLASGLSKKAAISVRLAMRERLPLPFVLAMIAPPNKSSCERKFHRSHSRNLLRNL